MKSPKVRAGLVAILTAGAVVALVFFAQAAVRYHTDQATAWFTGIAVVVAIVALLAAGLAAIFAYPAYHEWEAAQNRHPDVQIGFEAGPEQTVLEEVDPGKEVSGFS